MLSAPTSASASPAMPSFSAVRVLLAVLLSSSVNNSIVSVRATTHTTRNSNSNHAKIYSGNGNGNSNANSNVVNLPLGEINVVVLTDVHSWVGSHRRQEPHYDADLGDVLSFWENLKGRVESENKNNYGGRNLVVSDTSNNSSSHSASNSQSNSNSTSNSNSNSKSDVLHSAYWRPPPPRYYLEYQYNTNTNTNTSTSTHSTTEEEEDEPTTTK
mmetsp:Transcript_3183/g.5634  ORF Transcript_3183/g.5634 Transcript_3183/m.5634 type:complete len:214 (+) Transcript_3183:180-821(+)